MPHSKSAQKPEIACPPRVLVVEDDWLIRDMIVRGLEEAGFAILDAATGDEAVSLLGSERLACLVTDIQLPGSLDGWSVAARARERQPELPIVYVTGYSPEKGDSAPPGRLLRKPYRPSELIGIIRSLVEPGPNP